jgi:2-phosphoglycerate kinase
VKLPKEVGDSKDPFLYVGTKQAWRHFGELNAENVIKGLLAVRKSMQPYTEKELTGLHNVIFEASFLDPKKSANGKLYLVVTLDENKHREQFFRERKFFHPQYGSNELEEGFKASRLIQAYLIEEAKGIEVITVHNESDQDKLLSQFSDVQAEHVNT